MGSGWIMGSENGWCGFVGNLTPVIHTSRDDIGARRE